MLLIAGLLGFLACTVVGSILFSFTPEGVKWGVPVGEVIFLLGIVFLASVLARSWIVYRRSLKPSAKREEGDLAG
jgi:hypothetical protein